MMRDDARGAISGFGLIELIQKRNCLFTLGGGRKVLNSRKTLVEQMPSKALETV
jgi:hypothetical protein